MCICVSASVCMSVFVCVRTYVLDTCVLDLLSFSLSLSLSYVGVKSDRGKGTGGLDF